MGHFATARAAAAGKSGLTGVPGPQGVWLAWLVSNSQAPRLTNLITPAFALPNLHTLLASSRRAADPTFHSCAAQNMAYSFLKVQDLSLIHI